jgi:hypothetical protein
MDGGELRVRAGADSVLEYFLAPRNLLALK